MKQPVSYTQPISGAERYLLSGTQWFRADAAPIEITYSFPKDVSDFTGGGYQRGTGHDEPYRAGFAPLDDYSQSLFRQVFDGIEQIANIRFVAAEKPSEATLRIAATDLNMEGATAYAFPPSVDAPLAREAWPEGAFNTTPYAPTRTSGDVWVSSAWLNSSPTDDLRLSTFTHEIGHALGLGHLASGARSERLSTGQNPEGIALDYARSSVMSYNSWPADVSGEAVTYSTVALTMMPLDIAALQTLYGESRLAGNDVYVLGDRGQWNRPVLNDEAWFNPDGHTHVFPSGYVTIVDSGGYNHLEILSDSGVIVDLRPGSWSWTGGGYETYGVDGLGYSDPNLYLDPSTVIHSLRTGAGNDQIALGTQTVRVDAGGGDDTIVSGRGAERINGGEGQDTLNLGPDPAALFHVVDLGEGSWRVTRLTDPFEVVIEHVEYLQFQDQRIEPSAFRDTLMRQMVDTAEGASVQLDDTSALLYRAYLGGLGRVPDQDGYAWWLAQVVSGQADLSSVAAGILRSAEFVERADDNGDGRVDNGEFLQIMYENVFGRTPDSAGFDWWMRQLDNSVQTPEQVFIDMIQTDEFQLVSAPAVNSQYFL